MLGDCEEFLSVMAAGKALFRVGSAAVPVDGSVVELVGRTRVPEGASTIFVLMGDVGNPRLGAYLRGELAKGLRLTLTLVDVDGAGLVSDVGELGRVRDVLGVEVSVPAGVVLPAGLAGQLAESNGVRLLVPGSTVEQRDALRRLGGDGAGQGWDRLVGFLGQGLPGLTGERSWIAEHAGVLGVPLALLGDMPGFDVAGLLESAAPVGPVQVEEALGGEFRPVDDVTVRAALSAGKAAAVLLHGWNPGETEREMRWLVRDPGGTLRWGIRNGDDVLPVLGVSGATDPLARLLEQPHTRALMLAPDKTVYVPPVAGEPVAAGKPAASGLYTPKNTRVVGQSILVGSWNLDNPGPNQLELLEMADRIEGPKVIVEVRVGRQMNGKSSLEPNLALDVHQTLLTNPGIAVVVFSEPNDQLLYSVTQQHLRAAVVLTPNGFGKEWEINGPEVERRRIATLDQSTLGWAQSLARLEVGRYGSEVEGLVAASDWPAAAAKILQWTDVAGMREAAEDIVRMIEGRAERGLLPDRTVGGTGMVKENPFYVEDRVLPAFSTILRTMAKTQDYPGLKDAAPILLGDTTFTEQIVLPRRPFTVDEFLDHLTNKPLSLSDGSTDPSAYKAELGRLGLLIVRMLNSDVTNVMVEEVLSIMRAKGELHAERRARTPNEPEWRRSLVRIIEALAGIAFAEYTGPRAADLDALAADIICLNGDIRVWLLLMIKRQVMPYILKKFPDKGQAEPYVADLDHLATIAATCP